MVLGRVRDDRFDLKGLIKEAMSLVGEFNLADYVPWLGVLDLQGLTRKLKRNNKALDDAMDAIVEEHEKASREQNPQHHHHDFIHILLSLMHQPMDLQDDQSHAIDKTNIKAILLDMVAGATDTSIVVIEWALSELLRHPRVMANLQNELQNVVRTTRMVEESDLARLSYLDMVIKETLRLYPVAPLLVPRESMEDITINEGCYYVSKKSRIIVNVWAIGRDPKVWSENSHEFFPERFVDNNIDIRGRDFQLLPFGSGRRGCPGINLGLTTVKLVVAQLVHCFCWELPYGMSPNDLDMNEKFGLAISRGKHLLAIPTYRLPN